MRAQASQAGHLSYCWSFARSLLVVTRTAQLVGAGSDCTCLMQLEAEALQHTEAIQAELGGLGIGGEPVSLLSSIDGVHLDELPLHDADAGTTFTGGRGVRVCADLPPSPDLSLDDWQDLHHDPTWLLTVIHCGRRVARHQHLVAGEGQPATLSHGL